MYATGFWGYCRMFYVTAIKGLHVVELECSKLCHPSIYQLSCATPCFCTHIIFCCYTFRCLLKPSSGSFSPTTVLSQHIRYLCAIISGLWMNINLTLWNGKTLNYWEKLCIQSFSPSCQFILEQTIHEHNALYSVAVMGSACTDTQKSRYPSTVPTDVTWASKSHAYMTW
jgi:hypothetical protein